MKIDLLVFAFEIPSGAPKLPLSLKEAYPNKNTALIILRLSRFVVRLTTKKRHVSLINNWYVKQNQKRKKI